MKKFAKKLLSLIAVSSLAQPIALTAVSAQVVETELANQILNSDTDASVFDTVAYEIVDAELPSDRIVVDPASIYSENHLDLSEYYSEIVDQGLPAYHYLPSDNFRDITTYASAYLYYADVKSVEIIAPINNRVELLDIFPLDQLIANLFYDVDFKNQQSYKMKLTDDLKEAYDLTVVYTPAMMADVKANVMRAEDIMANSGVSESDYSYTAAQDFMDQLYEAYDIFEKRYNNAVLARPEIEFIYSEEAEESAETEETMVLLEESMEYVPDHLKQRMHTVRIVAMSELPPSWDYSPIDAYATSNLDMHFSDFEVPSQGLVYHELGHVLDYATSIPEDVMHENIYSLSTSPEWEAVHNAEWAEEGSYYNSITESFAQAFGAYATEYYTGQTMEEVGYTEAGLESRPESRAFMEQVFKDFEL